MSQNGGGGRRAALGVGDAPGEPAPAGVRPQPPTRTRPRHDHEPDHPRTAGAPRTPRAARPARREEETTEPPSHHQIPDPDTGDEHHSEYPTGIPRVSHCYPAAGHQEHRTRAHRPGRGSLTPAGYPDARGHGTRTRDHEPTPSAPARPRRPGQTGRAHPSREGPPRTRRPGHPPHRKRTVPDPRHRDGRGRSDPVTPALPASAGAADPNTCSVLPRWVPVASYRGTPPTAREEQPEPAAPQRTAGTTTSTVPRPPAREPATRALADPAPPGQRRQRRAVPEDDAPPPLPIPRARGDRARQTPRNRPPAPTRPPPTRPTIRTPLPARHERTGPAHGARGRSTRRGLPR